MSDASHPMVFRVCQAITRNTSGTELNLTRSFSPMYSPSACRATGRLVEMVSSILDVHRIESGKMPMHLTRCDLRHIFRSNADNHI